MTEAVLFDLDGTLIDSDATIVWCVNELLKRHGFDTVDAARVIPLIGVGLTPLLAHFFDDPESYVLEYRALYREGFARRTIVYPGAVEMLRVLKKRGIKIAIVTNRNVDLARDIIKTMGFSGEIDVLVGENTSISLKPDPAMILEACRILNADPRDSVMVGDTDIDVKTGRAAGCRTVYYTRGLSDGGEDADHVITTLAELEPLV